ncbi:MAG: DNA polymerase III subunit delta [Sphaerochaetaceae bacterium]
MMAPAYLLLGPENGEKQTKFQQIQADIRKQVGSEPELYRFYPFEAADEQIFTVLDNDSFFSEHRLVVLDQAHEMNATLGNAIASYLAHPCNNATLVLISEELSLSRFPKITKLVPKENTFIFWELYDTQKSEWVRQYFRQQGLVITNDAVDTLLNLVNNNTIEMKTTCNQLALFWQVDKKQGTIDDNAVETYIQHSRNEDAFTLFPAIAKRDLKQTLRIIHSIIESGDSGVSIVTYAGLLWQFRRLYSVAQAYEAGHDEMQAFNQASVAGKATPVRSLKDKNTYRTALKNYTTDQCRDILIAMGKADIPLKGAADLSMLLWEKLLYEIIILSGKETPSVEFASLRDSGF